MARHRVPPSPWYRSALDALARVSPAPGPGLDLPPRPPPPVPPPRPAPAPADCLVTLAELLKDRPVLRDARPLRDERRRP
jgi:hypothetical protein